MGGFFGEISFGRLEDAFFEEGIELVRGGFGLGFMGKKSHEKMKFQVSKCRVELRIQIDFQE